MAVDSITSLLTTLRRHQLLDPAQLDELNRLVPRFPEPRGLARELLNRGWLTPYQINQLFQGRNLVVGGYVLLERLGEGGMGKVYKARHQKLNRVVALKLIRPEYVTNADAIRRFVREIQVAGQLSHPNVVQAYDAGQEDDGWFFVMEYVEGIDMSWLVRQKGPLPLAQACDYVRQAALGLQHAHERGLVHRDIKPSNLLLTALKPGVEYPAGFQGGCLEGGANRGDVVKLLDLGLARLTQPDVIQDTSGTLTQAGQIVGSPDFIAPEQARDARTADGRADLYSLGCTFYFLLTGQVPFPGGSMTEKLLKHHLDQPVPIRGLRPEVPDVVAAVIDRLLAKRPEDRFQTPAELAGVLAKLLSAGVHPVAVLVPTAVCPGRTASGGCEPPVTAASTGAPGGSHPPLAVRPGHTVPRRVVWAICLGLVVVLGLVLVIWGLSGGSPSPTPRQDKPSGDVPDSAVVHRAENVLVLLEKQGAKARHDNGRPGRPVVELNLKGCRLQDDEAELLDPFTELRVLALARPMGNEALKHLAGLTRLRELDLSGTRVSDAGLAFLDRPPGLEGLDLSETRVGAAGLEPLRKLTGLRQLSLNRTQVNGQSLTALRGLGQLRKLFLANTQVGNLAALRSLGNLEVLVLDETPVNDDGLKDLAGLKKLGLLALRHTNLKGPGLVHLAGLSELTNLYLNRTQVDDRGLEHLRRLPRLHTLDLANTRISKEGLPHLQKMEGLRVLTITDTPLAKVGQEKLKKALPKVKITP